MIKTILAVVAFTTLTFARKWKKLDVEVLSDQATTGTLEYQLNDEHGLDFAGVSIWE